jgi:hypothetical protein
MYDLSKTIRVLKAIAAERTIFIDTSIHNPAQVAEAVKHYIEKIAQQNLQNRGNT